MKVNLYSESPDPGPGGAEQFVAVLAEALSMSHEVCLVHHKESLTCRLLEDYSGCDLGRVTLRFVAPLRDESHRCRTPWTRFLRARAWRRELSQDCDVFVGLLHNKAPFCRAGVGVMVVLFPTYEPFRDLDVPPIKVAPREPEPSRKKKKKKPKKKPKPKPKKNPADAGRAGLFAWRWLHRRYCHWEWKRRMATYRVKLSISDFSREWALRRWEIESGLLYPPVKLEGGADHEKETLVLSVGRFATTGHTKKQLEMLGAFRELSPSLPPGWRYACVGGLNESPGDLAYFDEARQLSLPHRVEVLANIQREHLRRIYSSASIFWHAAGLGDDIDGSPELAEHFGLTTVEAMAAGCVPVVINKGGQPEIVEHGVSGFVWDTLEELKDHTRRLVHDPDLRRRMSVAAKARAARFSRKACVEDLIRSLELAGTPLSVEAPRD